MEETWRSTSVASAFAVVSTRPTGAESGTVATARRPAPVLCLRLSTTLSIPRQIGVGGQDL